MKTYMTMALALLLAAARAVAQEPTDVSKMDYAVYCEHTYAQAGSTAELYIKLKTGMVCGAWATDIAFPEGITVTGYSSCSHSSMQPVARYVGKAWRQLFADMLVKGKLIPANTDQELVKLTLQVDDTVSRGDHLLRFYNVEIASHNGAAGTAKRPGEIMCLLTVQDEPVYDAGYTLSFDPITVPEGLEHDAEAPEHSTWLTLNVQNARPLELVTFDLTLPEGMAVGTYTSKKKEYPDPYYAWDHEFAADSVPECTLRADGTYGVVALAHVDAGGTALVRVPLVTDASLAGGCHDVTLDHVTLLTAREADKGHTFHARPFTASLVANRADTRWLDLREAKGLRATPIDVNRNPNVLIVARDGQVANEHNVVVDGVCQSLLLADGQPFEAVSPFVAKQVSYARPCTSQWGTVCFPCALDSDEGVQYYALAEVRGLTDTEGVMLLDPVDHVEPNTPAVFRLLGEATDLQVQRTDAQVEPCTSVPSWAMPDGAWSMRGVYEPTRVDEVDALGRYYISKNQFWQAREYFTLAPFRAYFEFAPTAGQARYARLSLGDNTASALDAVPEARFHQAHVYGIDGMVLPEGQPQRGWWITNGKKYLKR